MKARESTEVLEKNEVKNFEEADQVREFPHGRLELLKIGGTVVGRSRLEPGWKWSEAVKPIAKTDSCEGNHFLYCLSGAMKIRMDDGKEFECRAGDVCVIPPGHDAWVLGNEPVEVVDFQGMGIFAEAE